MEDNRNNETVDLRGLFIYYLSHWKLILGCGIFSFIVALLYLLLYPKTFEASAQIIFQDDRDAFSSPSSGLGNAAGLMASFKLGSGGSSSVVFDDELKTLTSNQLVREMVKELGLYVDYMEPYTFGYRMYGQEPLKISCDSLSLTRLERTIKMELKHLANGQLHIDTDVKFGMFDHHKQSFVLESLPGEILVENCKIKIDYASIPNEEKLRSFDLLVNVNPLSGVAEGLIDEFKMEDYSNASNVLQMSCTDYEPKRALDMFTTLITCYNRQADLYKQQLASNSMAFLSDRLEYTLNELLAIESKIESYKSSNKVTMVELDVQTNTEALKELQSKLIELQSSLHLIDLMEEFLQDPNNRYKLVPSLYVPTASGSDGASGNALSSYNAVLLERERVIKNSSERNPMVATLSSQADRLRESVNTMISNSRKSLEMTMTDIKRKENGLLTKLGGFPQRERAVVDLRRQQEIYQGVYLVLLQKREDIVLAMNQGKERAKVIDAPYIKSAVVAPRKLYAAIGIVFFTLFFSIGWLCSKWLFLSVWTDLKAELEKNK